ncbi:MULTISPECIES: TrkA C-terminal domain-containing protein [Clostridium]|uniref:Mannosyl-D-glycerate transport/metabolism system repressor MngR n=3 Tax=Clostridium TaxID=1485 RepID=D8GI07_CLOLD|nr:MULTISPECIES: TrkA C-terminal domain-containing protein [Clostridium]ADK14869.1 predicted transcriptional regulator [Clostridium ljungdahlii DSM 13528]AGY78116.1 GntR family transcriptional regulator [Clostridium autoethanogenum DSM 10061]ALU38249.1 TrkA-C domain protein [Clostridium autoethanogenum DSM 10061]OAA87865.1 Mannosyl-D-glycerate transport/metabolism system repressor MngR [Clostridium ljungdahlii DSM 13528]OVY51012.1 Mannosyl-D-glycerate transport/metabolism system repressor MngR
MSSQNVTKPVYQKIAIDIANRILDGDFSIGDKLHGRSSLSSHYNVSPETVRRAIMLLNEVDIVEVIKGSGIIVKSVDNCLKFINKFKDIGSMNKSKNQILGLLNERNEIEKKIGERINELLDYSNRFVNINPFMPFEFKIYKGLSIVGKTICESKFWQNTNATIIGIRREGNLILSPGPYAVFKEEDIFLAIGEEDVYHKIKKFLYGDNN